MKEGRKGITEKSVKSAIVVKSSKKDKRALKMELVYSPNRVTEMIYDMTLLQEKIFSMALYYLQDAIKASMNGVEASQLSLFIENPNSESIFIDIPLGHIATPQQYPQVRESAEGLLDIRLAIPVKEGNEDRMVIQGLIVSVNVPGKPGGRSSYIRLEMKKMIALLIIEIERKNGKPIHYNSFLLQVVMNASCKYTPKIYRRISSWKGKGEFRMTIKNFRTWLCLEDSYPNPSDLKRFVLLPVQKELEGKVDFWFDCNANDFWEKSGGKLAVLNFRLITPKDEEKIDTNIEMTKRLLSTHQKFTRDDFEKLSALFSKREVFSSAEVVNKLLFLRETLEMKRLDRVPVNDPKAYIITSLLREFVTEK